LDEALGGIGTPSEFALEPRQPMTMAAKSLALREPVADLDYINDDALAELADGGGVLGKAGLWRGRFFPMYHSEGLQVGAWMDFRAPVRRLSSEPAGPGLHLLKWQQG
jgi:hypothetical protein